MTTKSEQISMPKTDFVEHINFVKSIDESNAHSTSDMASMMNEWKVEVSKLRGFRAGVEGGAHCDYFYNGISYTRDDVTARGVFHSARDPYAIEETSRRWRRGPLAGD